MEPLCRRWLQHDVNTAAMGTSARQLRTLARRSDRNTPVGGQSCAVSTQERLAEQPRLPNGAVAVLILPRLRRCYGYFLLRRRRCADGDQRTFRRVGFRAA